MENNNGEIEGPTDQINGSVIDLLKIVEEHFVNHAITIDQIDNSLMNQREELQFMKSQQSEIISIITKLDQSKELKLSKFQLSEMIIKFDQRLGQLSEMSLKQDQILDLVSSIIIDQNDIKTNKTRNISDLDISPEIECQQDDDMIIPLNGNGSNSILNIQGEEFKNNTVAQNKEADDIEVSF